MYKVGIELEIKPARNETMRTILEHLRSQGINIRYEGYTHEVMPQWKAVSDSSLNGGFEIVSMPMSGVEEIEREVKQMTDALKGKARVDRECGHHIHISVLEKYWARRRVDITTNRGKKTAMRSKQVKIFSGKLIRNYSHFQNVIDSIVAPSRRVTTSGYSYNSPMPAHWTLRDNQNIEEYVNELRQVTEERHSVINFFSLAKYGTVEFRQFQGTINKVKIMNWMKLTERFCARTSDRKYKNHSPLDYPQTIDGMCDFLGFGKYGVRRWARSRALSNGFPELANERAPEVVNPISGSGNRPQRNSRLYNFPSYPDRRNQDGSPVYGTLDYEVELHMANDQTLYSMITEYRTVCRGRNNSLSPEHIQNLVTLWNRSNDSPYDDLDLRTNVNYLKLTIRLESDYLL